MKNIEAETAKLAGLQIDLLQKVRSGKITLKQFEDFLNKKTKHTIDLGALPRPPFNNAEVVKHESEINGKKIVEIELRSDDDLYIDGKKVVLHLSERQKGDKKIVGNELRQELESGEQVLLNSNVLDYIFDHPELSPEHWKKDENGNIRFIYFWGSIFRNPSSGSLCVRCLYWYGDSLDRVCGWLCSGWGRQDPSASVAS
jgi:hypothetical protein